LGSPVQLGSHLHHWLCVSGLYDRLQLHDCDRLDTSTDQLRDPRSADHVQTEINQISAKNRSFRLGHFGWVANILTVVMAIIATVFYNFPTIMPITPSNMSK
jgi:hypothetical protein